MSMDLLGFGTSILLTYKFRYAWDGLLKGIHPVYNIYLDIMYTCCDICKCRLCVANLYASLEPRAKEVSYINWGV